MIALNSEILFAAVHVQCSQVGLSGELGIMPIYFWLAGRNAKYVRVAFLFCCCFTSTVIVKESGLNDIIRKLTRSNYLFVKNHIVSTVFSVF